MADQEGACKSGEFIVVSLTPDVCWTPVGSTLVPVPYMIQADLSDSLTTSPDTRFGGQPVFCHDQSKISHVTGGSNPGHTKGSSSRSKAAPRSVSTASRLYATAIPVR